MALFETAWGGVRLWIASLEADEGRDVIVQPYSSGNVPDMRDRGNTPHPARYSLLFDQFPGDARDAKSMLEDLILQKEQQGVRGPQLFTHPLWGTYLAFISEFSYSIDSNGVITGNATFLAAEEINAVTVDPIGVGLDVSADDIEATSAELTAQLTDVDMTSTLPALAVETSTETFAADTASARDVLVEIATLSDRISDEIDDYQVAAAIETWPAMKAYVMLNESIRAGGDRALGDTGAFMSIRVDQTTSLRRLVADLYVADEAEDRYTEAMQLNDIRTPGAIPSGTTLRLRQPSSRV